MQTYVADSDTINNTMLPTRAYRQFLIDGAIEHRFPQEYIDFLTAQATVDYCP